MCNFYIIYYSITCNLICAKTYQFTMNVHASYEATQGNTKDHKHPSFPIMCAKRGVRDPAIAPRIIRRKSAIGSLFRVRLTITRDAR